MTPVILLIGQSNAYYMGNAGSLETRLAEMGSDAMVLNSAVGGTPLAARNGTDWFPADDNNPKTGELYDMMLDDWAELKSNVPDAYVSSIVWVQGEADSKSTVNSANYEDNLNMLMDRLEDDFGDKPVTIVQLADQMPGRSTRQDANWEAVMDAQDAVAKGRQNVTLIDPDDAVSDAGEKFADVIADGLHYNKAGYDILADAILDQPVMIDAVDGASKLVLQSGETSITQPRGSYWAKVEFDTPMEDPIVTMGPLTQMGADPAHTRVKNVTKNGFEFQVEEWSYLNSVHGAESVSWMAVERGTHVLDDGAVVQAGSTSVGSNTKSVSLSSQFDSTPVVLGQVASENDADPVSHRFGNVGASGFKVALHDEDAVGVGGPGAEDFHWIALEQGQFEDFAAGRFAITKEGGAGKIVGSYDGGTLADIQTGVGDGLAVLRVAQETATRLDVDVQEDKANQNNPWDRQQSVGWVRADMNIFT